MGGHSTDRDADLRPDEIRLPDGRRLVYYRFPEDEADESAPLPAPAEGTGGNAGRRRPDGGPPEGG
jgi:hypothetical protein